MYCFPYPPDAPVDSIRAPLLARNLYSIGEQINSSDFFWKALDAELQRAVASKSAGQNVTSFSLSHLLAPVIQSLLFFGVASEALGRNIRHDEFASVDPHGSQLSIDVRIPKWYWQELKDRWNALDNSLTARDFIAKRAPIKELFEKAWIHVLFLDLLANSLNDDELSKILLSIHMLYYLVEDVLDYDKVRFAKTNTSLASTNLLKRRMIKNGWCEKRLNFLDTSPMCYSEFYYLSSLKPPRFRAENHSSCSSKQCFVNSQRSNPSCINEEDQPSCSSEQCLVTSNLPEPRHRTEDCLCEDVVVPINKVNDIVAHNGIPLVRITRTSHGKIELAVVPYTSSSPFVAISHVWADQQFGSNQNRLPECQVRYLEEVLSILPSSLDQWGWREWVEGLRSWPPGKITPPSRAYEYFWLDTFCVPQAQKYKSLRIMAMDSMNKIYATASYTLVFDKGLQALDAGRRPASLNRRGRPTYYCPQDENLLDVVANIYASNWMGRAWTLQEGVLSADLIFPLHGSLAYLKSLWPHYDSWSFVDFCNYLVTTSPKDFRRPARELLPRSSKPRTGNGKGMQDKSEPFRELVRRKLFTSLGESLQVEEYSDYARTPADRAARFVKAHSLLQTRTTTQTEDIPLILMNLSCMNANAISKSKTVDEKMKQLVYGLKSLPTELLFSNCDRLRSCTVDAWIPSEIVPESFMSQHTLELGSAGFTFVTEKGSQALKFYLLPSAHRSDRFQLLLLDGEGAKSLKYNVEALQRSNGGQRDIPASLRCIVVSDGQPERGARFVVNRVVGDKYFLNFDCSLRLAEIEDSGTARAARQDENQEIAAAPLQGNFILERNHEPQYLNHSRPQNPKQSSDRLELIVPAVLHMTDLLHLFLFTAIWGDENSMKILFYIVSGLCT